MAEFLYLQAKVSVKNITIPVLKASEYQINKVHSQRNCSDKFVEDNWEAQLEQNSKTNKQPIYQS